MDFKKSSINFVLQGNNLGERDLSPAPEFIQFDSVPLIILLLVQV